MPYASNDQLPDSVRHALPAHAQDIFREAFNSALEEYGHEENAFRVAWAAVKKRYRKEGDQWVPKEKSPTAPERLRR